MLLVVSHRSKLVFGWISRLGCHFFPKEIRCTPLIFLYLTLSLSFPFLFHSPLQQVVSAVRAGVNPSGNASNQTSLWDLSSSFFFAGTVITTIGKRSHFLLLSGSVVHLNSLRTPLIVLVACESLCVDLHPEFALSFALTLHLWQKLLYFSKVLLGSLQRV